MPDTNFDFIGGVLDPRITFTRTTAVTYFFNALGVLVATSAANQPRLPAYDPVTLENLGILVEQATTNQCLNNTMVGVVAGSPGTAPNTWVVDGDANGLLRTIVGSGLEDGIDYVDIRYVGTPLATAPVSVFYVGLNAIGVTPAQNWSPSAYYRLVAGTVNNVVFNHCYTGTDGVAVTGDLPVIIVPTNAKLRTQRAQATGALAAFATTTRGTTRLRADVTVGLPVDFTIRIGLPQHEIGLVTTTPMKTTGVSVTRTTEAMNVTGTNFSDWYNPVEGTVVVDFKGQNTTNTIVYAINNGATNLMRLSCSTTNIPAIDIVSSVTQANITIVLPGKNPTTRMIDAAGYKQNDINHALNGILGLKDTVCDIPVVNSMSIGCDQNLAGGLQGSIKSIKYLARRVSDEQLLELTGDRNLWVGAVLVADKPAIRIVAV